MEVGFLENYVNIRSFDKKNRVVPIRYIFHVEHDRWYKFDSILTNFVNGVHGLFKNRIEYFNTTFITGLALLIFVVFNLIKIAIREQN